jgi:superfamily II DNA or RNA helicase
MELTRPCQKRAHERTTELLETHDKCIVKMFCGTGKSRVIRAIILTQKKPLSIVVFPSLALIRQFTADYLKDREVTKTCAILNVSSEQLDDFQSTTEPMDIKKFTIAKKDKKMKIVCVTYQSLQVLLDNLGEARIGLACFDEAHRTTSPESVKLVYSDEYRAKYEKQVFFTATPANQNGITMFDRERDEMRTYGDCGPLASEYTYLQGLRDAILSLFELRVDLYTQDTLGNMYESIARAILTTGNTRVLTFHADAAEDSKSETSVLRFVDKAKFMESFHSVCAKEFPDKVGKFTVSNVTFTAITAETKNKDAILGAFETCTDDEIYIVSSCRTIGEGVDTKKANMCVFVDPKSSVISIIQNIGRICRKIAGSERQPATILVPVCIGWEKYVAAGDDAEKQDSLIREQLNDRENGDYNAIMNIVAALKQEDPELYELCLRYPSKFTESERKHALESQKKRNDPDDYVYGEEIDELVEDGKRVEIHTSNVDVPIVYRGFDDEACEEEEERPIQRFYEVDEENDDGEMETRYHRIAPVNEEGEEEEDSNRRLNPPKATNRPRMNIHTNDEIKLLWRIGDVALGEQFGSGVLECQVERLDTVELWKENHHKMCEFIDEKGRVPNKRSMDPSEKKLGYWILTQKAKYDETCSELSKQIMKNPEIWNIWTETLANPKYTKHLVIDYAQNWKNTHEKMCKFIDSKKKSPSNGAKEPEEKRLGTWIDNQKKNYNSLGPEFSKHIMKNFPEIWKIWTETLADSIFSEALADPVQKWKNKHYQMCRFIETNCRSPSPHSKLHYEKRLGCWISTQKANYDENGSEHSMCIMKTNPEVWQIWTETIADPKYNKHLVVDFVKDWKNNHKNVCEYIEKNGRAPSKIAKNSVDKKMGCWVSTQKDNYDANGSEMSKGIMKTNPELWQIWMNTLANPKYSDAFADTVQIWKNSHKKICEFIEKNGRAPSQCSKNPDDKILGSWIGTQKQQYNESGPQYSDKIMKTPEIWKMWSDLMVDPKYCEALYGIVENWKNSHKKMCEFIEKNGKKPSSESKDTNEKKMGQWILHQRRDYHATGSEISKGIMKNPEIWQIWTDTLADEKYSEKLLTPTQEWKNKHKIMCECIDSSGYTPSSHSKDSVCKTLGAWVINQKSKYNEKGAEFSKQIMKTNPEIWQIWTDTLADPKYHAALNVKTGRRANATSPSATSNKSHLIPNPTQESLECSAPETNPTSLKRVIVDSPYKLTGRAWATQKSSTTHEKLQSNPAEWHAYHAARDISFQGYVDQSQIPRNRVISHLGNKRKHRLRILDLGCGRNNIARHYADEKKFTIQGYDHVAEEGSGALIGNIADLAAQEEDESADICIFSQSLMGSDWRDYLTEGHRMLRYNGEFIISEHIKMLDDVRAELGRLGCKVESEDADASATDTSATDADDKVPKWFVLVARKV